MQDGARPELPAGAADAEVVDLLRRAAALQRLARCFAYPVPGHHATVLELLGHGSDDGPLVTLVAAWHKADEDAMRVAYSDLFLASTPCPPNETAWGDARRLTGVAAELADIQGFYRAFGFDLAEDGRDMPDHLCAELEFVAALLVKTAYAKMQGWHEAGEVTVSGARSFLETHLGRWIGAFAERLRELNAAPPYHEAADVLEVVIGAECERHGARPAVTGVVAGTGAEPEQFSCPFDGEAPGSPGRNTGQSTRRRLPVL